MSLSSLLVQREIASIREIEEALARQVLYGGDFVTNLFEVSRIEETVLMPVVAESFGLPVAPSGELPKITTEAIRLVTGEVAAERGFVPLEVGATLVVAVAAPLGKEAEQELTFALALPIEQRIAPLFRIRQALARDYGIPIDKRTARLITKVVNKGPKMASTFPPPLESKPKFPARVPSVAPAPPLPASIEGPRTTAAQRGTLVRKTEAPPDRPARRRRGPLTMDVATAELEASAERDVIFDVLFEFARQFFDYTALFIVHGDLAEGRDAFGDGAPRDKVARVGVPLDLDNMLSTARKEKKLVRAKPSREGIDPVLMTDLERDGSTECVVFPVVVRNRVVALLFGDGGLSGIDDVGVRHVEDLVVAAASAFERVIMRRKLKGGAEASAEKGVAAARRNAESVAPPPTQVSAPLATGVPYVSTHMSQRPAAEELAPPIRDLMAEPVSRVATTAREPTPDAILASSSPGRGDGPPPPGLLAVRWPSGDPIPREEPEAAVSRNVSAPPRTKSGSLKRAAAPPLEFGTPQRPTVVAEPPRTTRDDETGHSWSRGPDESSADPFSVVPFSPRAASPPPMPAAPITDMSPKPIGTITPITDRSPPSIDFTTGAVSAPPLPSRSASASLRAARSESPSENAAPTTLLEGELPSLPGVVRKETPVKPLFVVTPDKEIKPIPLSDLDATPRTAPVFDDAHETPGGAPVDPVLALSHRKGAPPAQPSEPKPMPPSEQQVSVKPHKPPSSRSDHSRVLPSVIVDVSSEYVTLVARVLAGPDEDAETDLLRAGGYAMPAIMAKFPGPISIEADRLLHGPLPRVAECGPIIRLIASQRRTALPSVLAHVESDNADLRFWATYLLTELVYPDAIDSALARAFDDDARVRRAARAAIRALAEAHPAPVIERLSEVAKNDRESSARRVCAVEALAETRDPLAVASLVPLLEGTTPDISAAARAALVLITGQDFGADLKRWAAWWESNKQRHRLEWLIDALMHDQRALRGAASEELKTITKEYFGYYDDLPKRERERSQSRYREWWDKEGRVRFSRASTRGA